MRHRLVHLIAAAALAITALAACGPTVQVIRAPDARIRDRAPWDWAPADRDGPSTAEGARIPDDSIAQKLRDAIEAELTARGHRRIDPDSAVFFVHFHVAQRPVTDTLPPRDDPPGVRQAPGTWGRYGSPEELDNRIVTWQEGMLVIDAVTADRGIVAWRGIIAGEVPEGAERRPAEAIRLAVRRLLRDFP